jgi:hypothetical protein
MYLKGLEDFKTYIRSQDGYERDQAAAYVDTSVGSTIPATDFTTVDYPYKRIVDMAKIAQKTGVIKGIIMQHSISGAWGSAGIGYGEGARRVYTALCEDLDLVPGEVPFIVGQSVSDDKNPGNLADLDRVVPAFEAHYPDITVAHVVRSDGTDGDPVCLSWNPNGSGDDQIHFSLKGYEELGKIYGKKCLNSCISGRQGCVASPPYGNHCFP